MNTLSGEVTLPLSVLHSFRIGGIFSGEDQLLVERIFSGCNFCCSRIDPFFKRSAFQREAPWTSG